MHKLKYFFIFIIIAVFPVINTFALPEGFIACDASLQEEIENMIIWETAKSNSGELKIISLLYIKDIIENKYTKIERIYTIYEFLEYLAFEGTVNPPEKLIYKKLDFPDVRIEAVKLLGQLDIIKAKMALIEILKYENNPLVLHEAIRALFLKWSDFYNNEEININKEYI